MKKEDLRPVEFKVSYNVRLGVKSDSDTPKTFKGWFHAWEKIVSDEKDETIYALVENESGDMIQVKAHSMRFTDR